MTGVNSGGSDLAASRSTQVAGPTAGAHRCESPEKGTSEWIKLQYKTFIIKVRDFCHQVPMPTILLLQ